MEGQPEKHSGICMLQRFGRIDCELEKRLLPRANKGSSLNEISHRIIVVLRSNLMRKQLSPGACTDVNIFTKLRTNFTKVFTEEGFYLAYQYYSNILPLKYIDTIILCAINPFSMVGFFPQMKPRIRMASPGLQRVIRGI